MSVEPNAEFKYLGDTPHARFWKQLIQTRADEMITDVPHLKRLRYDWDEVTRLQKLLGRGFAHRGTNLHELILKATIVPNPDFQDEEDEQNCTS